MKLVGAVVWVLFVVACGDSEVPAADAKLASDAPTIDAAIDASPDATPDAACETVLLQGGTDPTTQGWTISQMAPATITNVDDYTRIETTTISGARTSGAATLVRASSVDPEMPFAVEFVVLVERTAGHNTLDAPIALLGSFTPPSGVSSERAQMVYVDANAVGWADDTQRAEVTSLDDAYHTYVLAVDAQKTATLTRDGTTLLTRANYVTNGTMAIGDQTNDPDIDAAMRIRSVTKLCP